MEQVLIDIAKYALDHGNTAVGIVILIIIAWKPVSRKLRGLNGASTLHGRFDHLDERLDTLDGKIAQLDVLARQIPEIRDKMHELRNAMQQIIVERARDDERIKSVERDVSEMQRFCKEMHSKKD